MIAMAVGDKLTVVHIEVSGAEARTGTAWLVDARGVAFTLELPSDFVVMAPAPTIEDRVIGLPDVR